MTNYKLKDRRICITGMGIVASNGEDCKAFEESLQFGISGIKQLDDIGKSGTMARYGGIIRGFSYKDRLNQRLYPKEVIQRVKRVIRQSALMQETFIASALEAYEKAELWEKSVLPDRIGIVVAGNNLMQNLAYKTSFKYKDSLEFVNPQYALQFFDTNFVGVLSEILEIHGEGFTVGGASASGNAAILQAFRLIQCGVLDVCMVAGPMADFSPLEIQAFCNLGAMGGTNSAFNSAEICRPFDKEHEGFILGQGSGCIILESMESAKRRSSKIFGEILGGSIFLDANRLSDARKEGEVQAMRQALKNAKIKITDIDYINAHGTSTPLGDKVELEAVWELFGEEAKRIWINSTKGMTGHCLFSAGIIEAIASIIQLNGGFIHPNMNITDPIENSCRIVGTKRVNEYIKTAMSNSFGFGGINTSVIFRKFPV